MTLLKNLSLLHHFIFNELLLSDPLLIDEQRMAVSPQKYFRILDKVRIREGRPPLHGESLLAGVIVSPAPSSAPHTQWSSAYVCCLLNE